jgi:hypothetical protein
MRDLITYLCIFAAIMLAAFGVVRRAELDIKEFRYIRDASSYESWVKYTGNPRGLTTNEYVTLLRAGVINDERH